jgi:hypothetical protein
VAVHQTQPSQAGMTQQTGRVGDRPAGPALLAPLAGPRVDPHPGFVLGHRANVPSADARVGEGLDESRRVRRLPGAYDEVRQREDWLSHAREASESNDRVNVLRHDTIIDDDWPVAATAPDDCTDAAVSGLLRKAYGRFAMPACIANRPPAC